MIIRRATLEDAGGIAQVGITSWRETYRGIVPDSYLDSMDLTKRSQQVRAQLSDPKEVYTIVAEQDGLVVGYASGGPNRRTANSYRGELYSLYLLGKMHKQGIGQQLVQVIALHPVSQKEFPLQNGYPAVSAPQLLSVRHLLIDGCPATVGTVRLMDQGTACRSTALVAYTPHRELKYMLFAASYRAGDQTDPEMQEIIRSFHIQKVAGPDSKK